MLNSIQLFNGSAGNRSYNVNCKIAKDIVNLKKYIELWAVLEQFIGGYVKTTNSLWLL